jgi:phosphoglycolate phosphatase
MQGRRRFRAVLFDLDGTLLHTSPDLAAAANAALAECAMPAIEDAVVEGFVGKGVEVLVQRCLTYLGSEPSGPGYGALLAAFMRHYEALNGAFSHPYPGVLEGLEAMRTAGLQLGVCTNKPARFTEPLLERCNIAAYFSAVVSGDTTARKKPHPDMLAYAAERWQASLSEILMIGDSGNDAAAARAAGCAVWLVPYGYREGRPVLEFDCDGIVSGLDEAARLIAAGTEPSIRPATPI